MVSVNVQAKEGFSADQQGELCVILDTELSEELISEGLARELVSKIQQLRKSKDLDMMDRISIFVAADEAVKQVIESFGDYIRKETLADDISERAGLEEFELNGHKTGIAIEKN